MLTVKKKNIKNLKVVVTGFQAGSVLVKILESGRTGYIRQRELSWDRRVSVIPTMPGVGDELEAVVLREDSKGTAQLSLRALNDPWEAVEAERSYYKGQIVEGEVVNVRHFGAFVQLEPGIDALVRPQDVPLSRDQTIADALWIGDKVKGIVTNLSLELHNMS